VTARLLDCLIQANSNEFFGTLSSRLTASHTRLWSGALVVCFAEMEAATRDTAAVLLRRFRKVPGSSWRLGVTSACQDAKVLSCFTFDDPPICKPEWRLLQ
jgi:hypothetical protein